MIGLKFINTDELKSVEIIQIKHKKMWMTPELEVVDGRKTFGGDPAGLVEIEEYDPKDYES